MRVLLLDHEYPAPRGGHRLATYALARGLADHGNIVDVVTAGTREEHTGEAGSVDASVSDGLLTSHRLRSRRPGGLGYVGTVLPVVRRLLQAERYDVVHIACAHPVGAMLSFLDLRGAALVVSLRGPEVPGGHRGRWPGGRYPRSLVRWSWRRADRVIAASDALGRLARDTWPDLRYAVIPPGVDLARFRPRSRPARPHAGIRCLAVASLVERNGFSDLLRALALVEPERASLEIVGGGPEERTLRALATELGVTDRVTFAGRLDHGAVAGRYREADLFTLVRRGPSAGSVFAEAMASGLPIVGSDTGAVAELVRDGRNGVLVPPGDVAALAMAIRRLAGSPHARAEMGRRNRAEAEEHLGWERITARHLTIYNGLQRRAPAQPLWADQPSSIW